MILRTHRSDVKKLDENVVFTENTVLVGNDSNAILLKKVLILNRVLRVIQVVQMYM